MAQRAEQPAEAPEKDDVDEQNEAVEASQEISDAELELSRKVARRLGWVPKEEWKRNPSKWTDAPDYLEERPRVFDRLKGEAERTARAAADAIEEDRRRHREEAERKVREAQDPDERVKAARDLAQHTRPHPDAEAWVSRNPWFNSDPNARDLAAAIVNRGAARGLPIAEQLKAAEEEVRQRFPEHFDAEPRREVRLSEVRRAPQVQSGSRASQSQPKEKGFAELPRAAKDAFEQHFRKLKLDPERYAKKYWHDQETNG